MNFRKILPLFLFLTVFAFNTSFAQLKLKNYCNKTFDYCISYPAIMKKAGASLKGDGRIFTTDDDAKLVIWGQEDVEKQEKIEPYVEFAMKNVEITEKTIRESWFEFTGFKDGKVIYHREIMKANGNIMGFEYTYPSTKSHIYAPYSDAIAKSMQ